MDAKKQRTKEKKVRTKRENDQFNGCGGEQSRELNINRPAGCMVIEWAVTVHAVDNEIKNLL